PNAAWMSRARTVMSVRSARIRASAVQLDGRVPDPRRPRATARLSRAATRESYRLRIASGSVAYHACHWWSAATASAQPSACPPCVTVPPFAAPPLADAPFTAPPLADAPFTAPPLADAPFAAPPLADAPFAGVA